MSLDANKGYSILYPKNSRLQDLPNNDDPVKKMMIQLESKLIKNGLLAQFNDCLKQFIDAGVVAPISDFPEMKDMQKSYIPLCYSLANNDQATTKLQICTNSSFKAQPKIPSFNKCYISGPEYLNSLDSILTRWRFAAKRDHSDISKYYHRINTSPLDNSLFRLWLKPVLGGVLFD